MIDKYLISTCLFIIDDQNVKYSYILDKQELRKKSITDLNEAGLVVRIGYPFKDMANFNMQGQSHDIEVQSKDFIIEVKYLRPFKTPYGTYSNKVVWKEAFEKDYNWLCNEIISGKKGKRAFVLGWFNAYDSFSEIMHLGTGKGNSPIINKSRMDLLPFLNQTESNRTKDIFYSYSSAYESIPIRILGYDKEKVHCLFLGKPEDKFHFAIYF